MILSPLVRTYLEAVEGPETMLRNYNQKQNMDKAVSFKQKTGLFFLKAFRQ